MGDVDVIHTRHRDAIPVKVSRPCEERVIVIPTRGSEDRDSARAPVHVTLFADHSATPKTRVS